MLEENRAKGRVLEIEKMAILREKVTKTQGGKNETPDSEKSSHDASHVAFANHPRQLNFSIGGINTKNGRI